MFALIGEWWLSEPENRQALRMKISDCVSDSRSLAQNKERRGEERSDPGSECGPEYPVRPGYYQGGITIFATRLNKIQGIMSRALFNWQSLTLSLSECQKLHLSSHNKWRDQGDVECWIFLFQIFCMQEARSSRPPIFPFNLQTYLPDSPLPLSDMKENS